jgi:hypothetical protein
MLGLKSASGGSAARIGDVGRRTVRIVLLLMRGGAGMPELCSDGGRKKPSTRAPMDGAATGYGFRSEGALAGAFPIDIYRRKLN